MKAFHHGQLFSIKVTVRILVSFWLVCTVAHLCLENGMGDVVTRCTYSPTRHTGFGDATEEGVGFLLLCLIVSLEGRTEKFHLNKLS